MTIQEAISRVLPKEEVYSKIGEILSVNKADKTVDVRPIDGSADILGVILCAAPDGAIEIYPKLNSMAVITFFGKNAAYLGLLAEVDSIKITIEEQEIQLDNTGLQLKGSLGVASNVSNLKAVIGELLDFIVAIQVVTPAGNGVLLPALVPQLNALKSKFNSFLK